MEIEYDEELEHVMSELESTRELRNEYERSYVGLDPEAVARKERMEQLDRAGSKSSEVELYRRQRDAYSGHQRIYGQGYRMTRRAGIVDENDDTIMGRRRRVWRVISGGRIRWFQPGEKTRQRMGRDHGPVRVRFPEPHRNVDDNPNEESSSTERTTREAGTEVEAGIEPAKREGVSDENTRNNEGPMAFEMKRKKIQEQQPLARIKSWLLEHGREQLWNGVRRAPHQVRSGAGTVVADLIQAGKTTKGLATNPWVGKMSRPLAVSHR